MRTRITISRLKLFRVFTMRVPIEVSALFCGLYIALEIAPNSIPYHGKSETLKSISLIRRKLEDAFCELVVEAPLFRGVVSL